MSLAVLKVILYVLQLEFFKIVSVAQKNPIIIVFFSPLVMETDFEIKNKNEN